MREVLIDAHTHTVASGHAYSSLQEMAKAAADMGLEVLVSLSMGRVCQALARRCISRICSWFLVRCTVYGC